jgi:hypothetical protein
MTDPKKRKCNFSTEELVLLVTLVERKKAILLNMDSKAETNKRKAAQWTVIATEISSSCGVTTRSSDECKIRWQQLASKVRQEVDSLKKTGGGVAEPIGDISAKVWDILKNPASNGLCGVDTSGQNPLTDNNAPQCSGDENGKIDYLEF